jgi:hypothetical protein
MRAVKSALAFLLLAFSLSACNTLATRRDLYSPAKASGPYTEALYSGHLCVRRLSEAEAAENANHDA